MIQYGNMKSEKNNINMCSNVNINNDMNIKNHDDDISK